MAEGLVISVIAGTAEVAENAVNAEHSVISIMQQPAEKDVIAKDSIISVIVVIAGIVSNFTFRLLGRFCLVLRAEIFTNPKTFCYGYMWGCFIIHTHDGACLTNAGSVIQDQRVGTIQSLSNLTL